MPFLLDMCEQKDHNRPHLNEPYNPVFRFALLLGLMIMGAVFFAGVYQVSVWIARML